MLGVLNEDGSVLMQDEEMLSRHMKYFLNFLMRNMQARQT